MLVFIGIPSYDAQIGLQQAIPFGLFGSRARKACKKRETKRRPSV